MRNTYMDGYQRGTSLIRSTRKTMGWARGKGFVKKLLTNTILYNALADAPTAWGAGYIDAVMDSVN